MRKGIQWVFTFLVGWVLLSALASPVRAEPLLQLYLEGATYDSVTDTWVASPPGSSNAQPLRLWAIGNVSATPGRLIEAVRLSIAYDKSWRDGDNDDNELIFMFTPSTTGGYGGYYDPSTPAAPTFLQYGAENTRPILGDGSPLPWHGIFGPNTVWQEFALGDFTLTDSPIGDFIDVFPTIPTINSNSTPRGQINVYEITVAWTGGVSAHGAEIHFDLYNHYEGKNHIKARFAPFSHDSDATAHIIPAPPSLVGLVSMGAMGAVIQLGRHLRRKK